ncbi:MAG: TRAP transporter large permease [Qingshengfaniella sp.]
MSAFIGFCAAIGLALVGVPLGFALLFVGTIGFAMQRGWDPALGTLASVVQDSSASYSLSVMPMFILMGVFIHRARISDDLYTAAQAWLGHRRGGLAQATVAASALFGMITGSSLAAAATMSKVAIPQMRARGYADRISSGCVAASGVLGMLIPPSVPLMIYGLITDQDIRLLFVGVTVPGLMVAALFMGGVYIMARVGGMMPEGEEKPPLAVRLHTLKGIGATLVLFVIVIGGMYFGFMTVTEAAGIGSMGALGIVLWRRSLNFWGIVECAIEAARTTSMVFLIVFGAGMFSNFVNLSGLAADLSAIIGEWGLGRIGILLIFAVIYLVLGCVLETLGLMLLTVPVFLPIAVAAGIDPIYFGIFVVLMIEVGMLTPPIGMNIFTVKSVATEIPLGEIFRGVTPFILLNLLAVLIIIIFPALITVPITWF